MAQFFCMASHYWRSNYANPWSHTFKHLHEFNKDIPLVLCKTFLFINAITWCLLPLLEKLIIHLCLHVLSHHQIVDIIITIKIMAIFVNVHRQLFIKTYPGTQSSARHCNNKHTSSSPHESASASLQYRYSFCIFHVDILCPSVGDVKNKFISFHILRIVYICSSNLT